MTPTTAHCDCWETERPAETLADVAGMAEVKRRLNVAFLGPMRNPDMMALCGRSLRGGLLLYGPPAAARHSSRAPRRANSARASCPSA